jgi:dTDP-glucose 4,6-dehydratase
MGGAYLSTISWHNTNMTIIVTGGAGFIGSCYIDRILMTTDESVTLVDNLTYAGRLQNFQNHTGNPRFRFVQADICHFEVIRDLIGEGDYVVNFAAESHVDRSILSGLPFVRTNVLGTQVMLDISLQNKALMFIQVSTDEVYGSITEGSWDENWPLNPNSPYAASKAGADLMALSYFRTHNLDIRITRCCNNYGPRQFPEKLIPYFVKKLLAGQNLPVYGSGLNVREWIHVEDHISAIELVRTGGSAGEIYNIGSGVHKTNLEIVHTILGHFEFPYSRIDHVADRKGHDLRYSLNSDKIRKQLGFSTDVSFDKGMYETLDWYKNNKDSFLD